MVIRAYRAHTTILAPVAYMARLQREGWKVLEAEPGDPEVTEPTPLADVGPGVAVTQLRPVPAPSTTTRRRRTP